MLTLSQRRELENWLIRNQPQIQSLLQDNELKTLLYEVYEAGITSQYPPEELEEYIKEEVESRMEDDTLTNYSSVLIQNL